MKKLLYSIAITSAMVVTAHSATFTLANVLSGTGDTDALYQGTDDSLLTGGIVAMGYFNNGYAGDLTDLSSINNHITNFNVEASAIVGQVGDNIFGTGALPGYLQNGTPVSGSTFTGGFPVSQQMYVFVGNAATLAASDAWALKSIGTILDDNPFEQAYVANPFGGAAPLIGSVGSFTGDATGGATPSDTFTTLKLEAVPEPSAALLGALGSLLLLRRRRQA